MVLTHCVKSGIPLGWMKHPYVRRLPEHYIRHRLELLKPPARVHDDPVKGTLLDYKVVDPKTLRIERVPDLPVAVKPLENSNEGIFGGEGIVQGFSLPRREIFQRYGIRNPKIWMPNIFRTTIYSEILDKYLSILCTKHVLDKIDESYGFDNYILRTPVQDLQSGLAIQLRRQMLLALANKSFHPNNPEKFNLVYNRYKDCELPLEEAEWFGLEWGQAFRKQHLIELEANKSVPLKVKLGKELLDRLDELKASGEMPDENETQQSLIDRAKSIFKWK